MKVQAYLTSCCNQLKDEDNVYGVIQTPDLFDIYKSYTTVKPAKSNIHYCVDCYNTMVVEATQKLVRRKNNEENYQEKLREMSYVFKKSLFSRTNLIA